ncbi:protein IWS1 homolog A-like [Teleopsis dalmanni]|uniref:protein IWS1 homolog A-like n=1 Tax=Teleopsis dalmanni TaxID=139649 RepID=UPI0018CEEB75|nr:protein IWS1 homolog A-like [Teleopsis dalmanni]
METPKVYINNSNGLEVDETFGFQFESDDGFEPACLDSENPMPEEGTQPSTSKQVVPEVKKKHSKKNVGEKVIRKLTVTRTNDFDAMLQRKAAHRIALKNKLKSFELTNEQCANLVGRMFDAAQEDVDLYNNKQPAVKKVAMLKEINAIFSRPFQEIMLDYNILGALTAWITPISEHNLPYYPIRETVLNALLKIPSVDKDDLRASCVGKAVTFLSKHPDETLENKRMCRKLLDKWARQLYNIEIDYRALSTEERMARDLSYAKPVPKVAVVNNAKQSSGGGVAKPSFDNLFKLESNDGDSEKPDYKKLRTRIPLPCNKLFVNRPKNKVDIVSSYEKSKCEEAYDRVVKNFLNHKKVMIKSTKCGSKNFF